MDIIHECWMAVQSGVFRLNPDCKNNNEKANKKSETKKN